MPALRSRLVALTLGSLLVLSLTGCGDDDSSDSSSDTTEAERSNTGGGDDLTDAEAAAIGATPFKDQGIEMGEEAEICLGRSLAASLGVEGAKEIVEIEDLSDRSDEERQSVADAMNECVPGEAMATGLIASFMDGTGDGGEPDPELVACVTERIDGRIGDVMLEVSGDGAKSVDAIFGDCPTTELTAAALSSALTSSLGAEAAACVSQKVAGTIGLSDFVAADSDPAIEAQLQTAIEEAIAACPGASTGG